MTSQAMFSSLQVDEIVTRPPEPSDLLTVEYLYKQEELTARTQRTCSMHDLLFGTYFDRRGLSLLATTGELILGYVLGRVLVGGTQRDAARKTGMWRAHKTSRLAVIEFIHVRNDIEDPLPVIKALVSAFEKEAAEEYQVENFGFLNDASDWDLKLEAVRELGYSERMRYATKGPVS